MCSSDLAKVRAETAHTEETSADEEIAVRTKARGPDRPSGSELAGRVRERRPSGSVPLDDSIDQVRTQGCKFAGENQVTIGKGEDAVDGVGEGEGSEGSPGCAVPHRRVSCGDASDGQKAPAGEQPVARERREAENDAVGAAPHG